MGKAILVPVDFSDVTGLVLAEAAKLGKALGSLIYLIHATAPVIPPDYGELGVGYDYDGFQDSAEELQAELGKLGGGLSAKGLEVSTIVFHGRPVDVIVREAERLDPELVVLGSHGHGAWHRFLGGSVRQGVLRKVTCPVLIVPSKMAVVAATIIHGAAQRPLSPGVNPDHSLAF